MITVFTPTFNRAELLPNLYNSLLRQSVKNFEWLIVDDGSSDGTESLIQEYINEGSLKIRYYKQPNRGKYVAINKGVALADEQFFFIVDSDDCITPNAIQLITDNLFECQENDVCGLVFDMVNTQGNLVGKISSVDRLKCSLYDLKFKYKLNSDKAEIFKTEILRRYPFPEFVGEKFSPEALTVFRMSGPYKIVYINTAIYIAEYQQGGLTASMTKIRMNSPRGTTLYYNEHFHRAHNFLIKMKSAINFYRFRANNSDIENEIPFPFSLLKPIGDIMHIRDKKNINK